MSAEKLAWEAGYISLSDVALISGATRSALRRWHRENRDLLETVIAGCIVRNPPGGLIPLLSHMADEMSASMTDHDIATRYDYFRKFARYEFGFKLSKKVYLAFASEVVADLASEVQ